MSSVNDTGNLLDQSFLLFVLYTHCTFIKDNVTKKRAGSTG
jgi:hypothetical protein